MSSFLLCPHLFSNSIVSKYHPGITIIIIISSIIYLTENKLTSLSLRSTDGLSFEFVVNIYVVNRRKIYQNTKEKIIYMEEI